MTPYCSQTLRPWKRLVSRLSPHRRASSLKTNRAGDRLSILTNGAVTKQEILECIASSKREASPSRKANSSAILVSKDLSRWLDDADFMSAILHQLHPEGLEAGQEELSILTAAVDGLCPRSPKGLPSSGLSILQGDTSIILPGLWDGGRQAASLRQVTEDARPALSVRLNPLLGDFRPVDVTLPLANTVFQNARPFTLLASQWRRHGATGSPTLVHALEKETQRIVASVEGSIQSQADISAALFPLTAPRRITAGLGNIVRQIEAADGADGPRPASEELEASMHALINTRSGLLPGAHIPNRTWALILPATSASLDFLASISTSTDSSIESEHERADVFARQFSKVLADGGRLHRVLSGGGGWGQKRGLLSLDPETTYLSSGAKNLQSFMASFAGEATADSVVTPGSYVQFFVEPLPLSPSEETLLRGGDVHGGTRRIPSLVLGTTPAQLEGVPAADGIPSSADLVQGHFGALSSHGIYMSLESGAGSGAARGARPANTLTKIDVPGSYVWEGTARWI